MVSHIDGFFQVVNPHRFVSEVVDVTGSPSKKNKNLTVYDTYVALGSVNTRAWLPGEVRLYSPVQDLTDKVIHGHGRFVVISTAEEDETCIELEIHRFTIMDNLDPTDGDPIDFRTSITIYG